MVRRWVIWLFGALNVAMLVATPKTGWWTDDAVHLGKVVWSPDSPDFAIDATVEVGDGLLDPAVCCEVWVELSRVEPVDSWSRFELHVLEAAGTDPVGEPVGHPVELDGSEFDAVLAVALPPSELEELHLLVRMTTYPPPFDEAIEARVTLRVRAVSLDKPKDHHLSVKVER